jgi:hypothetical protein
MSTWTTGELDEIAAATELRITTRRADGTPRLPVPIWVVRAADIYPVLPWPGRRLVPAGDR